jgi:hypothetical protein
MKITRSFLYWVTKRVKNHKVIIVLKIDSIFPFTKIFVQLFLVENFNNSKNIIISVKAANVLLWYISSKTWRRVMETLGQWESQCWAVLTFFWGGGELTSSGPLMMLWEPDRFSNVYIYIYWAGEDWSGYQIFILENLPGSQIGWFSYIQQPVLTTWLLNFSLIKIS